MNVPPDHEYYAQLHIKATELFEKATAAEVDLNTLAHALELETEVANASITLGLSDLSKYAYHKGAAAMAHIMKRDDLAIEILERCYRSVEHQGLKVEINQIMEGYKP